MNSSLLVSRASAGDLESFGQLYDSSFNRVYDFAWRVLRDADMAGAVTADTFRQAAAELRAIASSGDFSSWVLLTAAADAIARAEGATRELPQAVHEEAFGTFDVPDPCLLRDPSLINGDAALGCTIWEAATTLGVRDYTALDLHVRHGLAPAALTPTLGVARGNAPAALERLVAAANDTMLGYVLVRRSVTACEGLRQVLSDEGFPPFTEHVQAAVEAHVRSCAVCRGNRALPAEPTEVLKAFAPVQAPFALKGETWRAIALTWRRDSAPLEPATAAVAAAGREPSPYRAAPVAPPQPGFGGAGFGGGADAPVTFGDDDARRNIVWFIGAAVGMLAVAFIIGGIAVGAFGFGGGGGNEGAAAAATGTSTPASSETVEASPTLGVHIDTPTPAPPATETPIPTNTPVPPPATSTPLAPSPTAARATPARPSPTQPVGTPTRTPAAAPPTPGGPPTPTRTPTAP